MVYFFVMDFIIVNLILDNDEIYGKKIDYYNWNSFKLKLVKVCME